MQNLRENFPALSFPAARLRVERDDAVGLRVYDPLRGKWVALTPEEWVRQHFTSWIVNFKGYPAGLTVNEVSLSLNRTSRRADTVVFDHQGEPLMVIEYKAPSVKLTQRVFDQILRYNIVFRTRYLVVTNGLSLYCCRIDDPDSGAFTFLTDFPAYQDLDQRGAQGR